MHCEKLGLAVLAGKEQIPGIGPSECTVFGQLRAAAIDIKPIELGRAGALAWRERGVVALEAEERLRQRSQAAKCARAVIWCARSSSNSLYWQEPGILIIGGSARFTAMVISDLLTGRPVDITAT